MINKMLIDATHEEETRVVVLSGERVEEFDLESAARRQLRGNIYLAKITRVEPSLQAAFVDYGGNRHGFLAFSEIHPDYYQIPVADRQALLAEAAQIPDDEDEPAPAKPKTPTRRRRSKAKSKADTEAEVATGDDPESSDDIEDKTGPSAKRVDDDTAKAASKADAKDLKDTDTATADDEGRSGEDEVSEKKPPKTLATSEGMGRVRRSRRRDGDDDDENDGDTTVAEGTEHTEDPPSVPRMRWKRCRTAVQFAVNPIKYKKL